MSDAAFTPEDEARFKVLMKEVTDLAFRKDASLPKPTPPAEPPEPTLDGVDVPAYALPPFPPLADKSVATVLAALADNDAREDRLCEEVEDDSVRTLMLGPLDDRRDELKATLTNEAMPETLSDVIAVLRWFESVLLHYTMDEDDLPLMIRVRKFLEGGER